MKIFISRILPRRFKNWVRNQLNCRVPDGFDDLLDGYRQAKIFPFADNQESNLARLRMHTHIIDKGLHRPDWQSGHSEQCYAEAQHLLEQVAGTGSDSTLAWAHKVIREYEDAQKTDSQQESPETGFCPGRAVDPVGLRNFFKFRTTCRNFVDKPVAREDMFAIVDAALDAPSSCCRQTLKVYASADPAVAFDTASCFTGFTGFSQTIPTAFVFCADIRSYFLPSEIFAPTFDTALAADHAALMAAAMGMSMAMLCWVPDKGRESRLRVLHGIPDYEMIIVGALCGYPKRQARKPPRKPVQNTLVLK